MKRTSLFLRAGPLASVTTMAIINSTCGGGGGGVAILDSARPRLVTGDAGPGSAQGVGVSGCELWERVGRAGCDGSGGRVRARRPP